MSDLDNLVKTSFLGFAIADALGVPVEFLSRNSLKKQPLCDMIGYGTHGVPEGTWSDDTSLMLATVDSINKKRKIDYTDIMSNFSNWYVKEEYTATDELFDIGNSTRVAIQKFVDGKEDATRCGGTRITDNGNGSLMRILPIAFYLYVVKLDEVERQRVIQNISSITHGHEISVLGCHVFCDYIANLLNTNSKIEALYNLRDNNYKEFYSEESIGKYSRLLDGSIIGASEEEIRSSGYVVDTLEAAIWSTVSSNSYEEAVLKAVNLGEDTDTVGAITGGINGIIYADMELPAKWIEKLKKSDYISSLSKTFSTLLKQENVKENNR